MLTKRQNFIETVRGGKPDRYVNQYEALDIILENPCMSGIIQPGDTKKSNWGVTFTWPLGTPGQMPIHDAEHLVIQDIEHWRDYVKAPVTDLPDEAWEAAAAHAAAIDTNEQLRTIFVAPGIFEQCHHLSELKNCLMYFLTNPDEMHELIAYITEWELRVAEQTVKHLKPEAVFHHDDWGTQMSTFLRPSMFADFYLEPYKQVYGYYKSHGVEFVIHHSDCYAATLVPYMIEMGIDVWQGVQSTNNIPELIKQYGGKMTFMGGIDSGIVDKPDWSREHIRSVVRKVCDECGTKYFIPCTSQGLSISTFPGVYDTVGEEIADYSKELFR